MISIVGLPKHAVLAALWSAAHRQSVFDTKIAMSETWARDLIGVGLVFDWVEARSIKVDLRGDEFDPRLYDRDNGGEGAAARAIERLRQYTKVPEHVEQQKVSHVDPGTPEEIHGHGPGQAQSQETLLSEGSGNPVASDGGQVASGG